MMNWNDTRVITPVSDMEDFAESLMHRLRYALTTHDLSYVRVVH